MDRLVRLADHRFKVADTSPLPPTHQLDRDGLRGRHALNGAPDRAHVLEGASDDMC